MSQNNYLRKTKIVATIGPACSSREKLAEMLDAGMNVARLNLSHGTFAGHSELIKRIREVARGLGQHIAIMIDTRGVEIRTGMLADRKAELERGAQFLLFTDEREGDERGVSITYANLPHEVQVGQPILLDDGAIELEITATTDTEIICKVVHGGTLGERKSINLPETRLKLATANPESRDDVKKELDFASANDIDYIAASFVQSADDIRTMREILQDNGMQIPIIAKIENKSGINNLDEIVKEADGVMVARGDLGVELPFGEVPEAQKRMIHTTVMNGKPVITATQMLASMENNPKPTRAEASDVANAILDGSSAIMLSGETATGKYPVEAVKTMHNLAQRTESCLEEFGYLQKILPNPSNVVTEAVSQAVVTMVKQLNAAAVFSLTDTGFTSRLISRHRPECPIFALTGSETVARRLSMNWGVSALLCEPGCGDQQRISYGVERARELGFVDSGDVIVATWGYKHSAGGTDMIRVLQVE
jgi:pyruvate kinase